MVGEASSAATRERGGRARRQRAVERARAVIAGGHLMQRGLGVHIPGRRGGKAEIELPDPLVAEIERLSVAP